MKLIKPYYEVIEQQPGELGMLKHIETEEQALAFGRQAMTYLVTGWFALFGVDLSEK